MNQYNQITAEERYHIYGLMKAGHSVTFIADELGKHRSSIYRELARNSCKTGYWPQAAQRMTAKRRLLGRNATKFTDQIKRIVELKLREKWSPEQISGWLKLNNDTELSHERIYQHIWSDKCKGGELYHHLRRHGKMYEKRRKGKTNRSRIKNQVSIDERPSIVDKKIRVGDWEIDTVVGKAHSGAFLTIVERKTKYTVAALIKDRTAKTVTETSVAMLKKIKHRVHTITADNGREFAGHEEISRQLDAKIYFAHPYHSWERGLNENTNGLLRQYFPKSMRFEGVSQQQLEKVIDDLNNRPRKTLGYKTPAKMMQRALSRAAA